MQEAFEQQVVLDGIDAGDAEHIGDDRVGGRATALAGNAMLAREAHEVPVDEEELGQPRLLDHLELALEAFGCVGSDRAVAVPHALEAELVEEGERCLPRRHGVARKANLAEVEIDLALLCDLPGGGERLLMALEERAHRLAVLQVMLGIGKQVRPRLVEGRAMADRDHHIVQPPAPRHVIVDLVGRHDRSSAAPCHLRPAFQHPWVLGVKVMVQLAENTFTAQPLLQST